MNSAQATAKSLPPVSANYSSEEWETRVGLAACYRLAVHFKMTDITLTHITARVPGPESHFLINPYGLMFHEVTASNLIKIDLDGNLMEESEWPVNRVGYEIHSTVHREHEHLHCVVHNHTLSGIAVSAQKEGLLPISHAAMEIGQHE